jgi:hypothetical protein
MEGLSFRMSSAVALRILGQEIDHPKMDEAVFTFKLEEDLIRIRATLTASTIQSSEVMVFAVPSAEGILPFDLSVAITS